MRTIGLRQTILTGYNSSMEKQRSQFLPPLDQIAEHRVLDSPEAMEHLGQALGRAIQAGLVIALIGPLGAGKTTFVRGLAQGLGIDERVTSPTFTLVNEYGGHFPGQPRLIHVDAYRLGGSVAPEREAETIGLSELLDDVAQTDREAPTVLVIEWAERVLPWLPDDRLEIHFSYGGEDNTDPENTRKVKVQARGPVSQAVLRRALDELEQPE